MYHSKGLARVCCYYYSCCYTLSSLSTLSRNPSTILLPIVSASPVLVSSSSSLSSASTAAATTTTRSTTANDGGRSRGVASWYLHTPRDGRFVSSQHHVPFLDDQHFKNYNEFITKLVLGRQSPPLFGTVKRYIVIPIEERPVGGV